MNTFQKIIDRFFPPVKPLTRGVIHFQSAADAPTPYRAHLRLETDGSGVLLLNASTVVHLNQTAAEIVYLMAQKLPEDQAVKVLSNRFRIDRDTARADFRDVTNRLQSLLETPDLDPVSFLDFERSTPYATDLSAPFRIDMALTYRTTSEHPAQTAPLERVKRELSTEEWKQMLAKAWQAGVPHAVFTGGEPTLRPDLVDLIQYGEDLGMVTGLLTDGVRLAENQYLHGLLGAGLDHILIALNPLDSAAWEAIRDVLAEDIALAVHLTLPAGETAAYLVHLGRLAEMGLQSISLSANGASQSELLQLRETAAHLGLHLMWDLPVPYSDLNPVTLELAADEASQPSGAGRAWLYVEPDGDVLPAQGVLLPAGNLLTDEWSAIWQSLEARGESVSR